VTTTLRNVKPVPAAPDRRKQSVTVPPRSATPTYLSPSVSPHIIPFAPLMDCSLQRSVNSLSLQQNAYSPLCRQARHAQHHDRLHPPLWKASRPYELLPDNNSPSVSTLWRQSSMFLVCGTEWNWVLNLTPGSFYPGVLCGWEHGDLAPPGMEPEFAGHCTD
jgi:hypothetical protein